MAKKKSTIKKKKSTQKKNAGTAKKKAAPRKKSAPSKSATTPLQKEIAREEKKIQKAKIEEVRLSKNKLLAVGLVVVIIVIAALMQVGENVKVVERGDLVDVEYVLTLSTGDVYDYGNISFVVADGEFLGKYESDLIGVPIDGEVTIEITPEESGHGQTDMDKVMWIPRKSSMDRVENATLERMKEFTSDEIAVGNTIRIRNIYWPVAITAIEDGIVTFRSDPEIGHVYKQVGIGTQFGWNITNLTEDKIIFKYEGIVDEERLFANVGSYSGSARIISHDENSIWLDFNHPLAGKILTYDLKVVGMTKD